MPTPIVIDLSHHNSVSPDLKATKEAGIIGVIHKATEGASFQDSKVDAREFLARDAKMLFGLYHFIRPGNISQQVDNFMSVYKRYDDTNLLVALDYEDPEVSLEDCETWMRGVTGRTNKKVVLYSGHVLKEKVAGGAHPTVNQTNYPLWLAQYTSGTPSLPKGWDSYWLWQYSDGEIPVKQPPVPGVKPPCDVNAGDMDKVVAFWTGGKPPIPEGVLDFSDAMRRILDGEKMRRRGWNGKGMWIACHNPMGEPSVGIPQADAAITLPFIYMSTVTGDTVPWLASQTDMLASDWEVAV
jgi:GH25 family lysozyme M1 (1,4-beta-N-acetylmuramidase)